MGYMTLVFLGALGGAATAGLIGKIAAARWQETLAMLLVIIAAIYVVGILSGEESNHWKEYVVAMAVTITAFYALRDRLLLLAAGYLIHGIWDAMHGCVVPHVLPEWYAPMCVGFDVSVAGYILLRFKRIISQKFFQNSGNPRVIRPPDSIV